ncbi:phosphate ABC transporter substrate-binding protein PstS [Synechococcus sp. RSCCF101]|uniref:phosphate ABC transporter substrate-binding protein PstS n=1 Tax=Synechococcus sp. RSCCF101 TaxID=2511069 RepID=UPI001244AF21|nr:phosphate ABC transporter substrate-binding protein PstS [Synechococcus sp. RSCCF101]QEY32600.1 phosphate ABC transporter substrate-binding protein PstS [Synechococcus sp. RSCCF101]
MSVFRRRTLRSLAATLGLAGTLTLAACGGAGDDAAGGGSEGPTGSLNAAGASFPAAIYQRWFQQLAEKGVNVNYQSVGSGAGVRQFQAETVDFAASDAPMKEDAIAEVSRGVLQIPMTAGAIAVAYNFEGCELALNQEQLAGIFLGSITNFSEVGCDDKPIRVVHRSDGSGTTFNFTKHLAAISPEWDGGPGADKSISWPVGVGAKGNEGVSAQLKQIDGGIGYVEVAYVKDGLQAAALENASGESVMPTNETESLALASIDLGPDLIGGNPNPDQGYPIVTFTWILAYETGNGDKTPLLKETFDFMLSEEAQAQAPELGYVTLPPEVVAKSKEQVARISE